MKIAEADTTEDGDEGRSDIRRQIEALSDADLLRLKALARLRAHGLPGLEGADVLNETVLRALNGSRSRPAGISLMAFLAMTMRSVADEYWRRVRRERRMHVAGEEVADDLALRQADDSPQADPERVTAAIQALAGLDRLFASDEIALKIMAGLGEGLSAREIRIRYGLTETTYDSARKRMRRVLLHQEREGSEP